MKTNHQSQLLRALNSTALVSITDNNGNIVFANNHFCKMSGYKEDELLGKNHLETTLNHGKLLVANLSFASQLTVESKNYESINFKSLITDVLKSLKGIQGYENIDFRVSIPSKMEFYSSIDFLRSILQNLVQNAIKYQRPIKRGFCSFIKIGVFASNNGINIIVQDNGQGINQDHLDKIFDHYFRTTTLIEGTGIGRYIAKNAVELLIGDITVSSIVTSETQFDIFLPNPNL